MGLWNRNGVYWYDFTWKGQRIRKSTEQRDKYLAGLVMNDAISKIRDQGAESVLREAPILKDFSGEFLKWVEDSHSIEKATKAYYQDGWRRLSTTKIAETRMDRIKNHLCETTTFPGGPASANSALRTLRRMFAKAKEAGKFFGEIPEIKLRKEWPRSIAMTTEQAASIASFMPESDARDIFQILRDTGMRPSECYSMRWEYVGEGFGWYMNPKGKRATSRRRIPMFGESQSILLKRYASQGSPTAGWVFPSPSDSGHIEDIGKTFRKARQAAGLPAELVLYTARHGVGTDLAKVLSLGEVMKVLGHSDTKTAMIYQNPTDADIARRLKEAKTTGRIQ